MLEVNLIICNKVLCKQKLQIRVSKKDNSWWKKWAFQMEHELQENYSWETSDAFWMETWAVRSYLEYNSNF